MSRLNAKLNVFKMKMMILFGLVLLLGSLSTTFSPNNIIFAQDTSDTEIKNENVEMLKIAQPYHLGYTPLKTGIYDQSALPLPNKVTTKLNDESNVELEVVWRANSEPVYDKYKAGQYRFTADFKLPEGIINPDGHLVTYDFGLTDPNPEPELEIEADPEPVLDPELDPELEADPESNLDSEPNPEIEPSEEPKVNPDKEIVAVPVMGSTIELGQKSLDEIVASFPSTVETTLDDETILNVPVKWNIVSNPVYNMNKIGKYMFSGEFVLPEGVINPANHPIQHQINVFDDEESEKNNESSEPKPEPEPKSEPKSDPDKDKEITGVPIMGSTFGLGQIDLAEIHTSFPSTVETTLEDKTTLDVPIKWNKVSKPAYDKNKVGKYMFSGEFILPEGISNTANHPIQYQINVFDYDISENRSHSEELNKTEKKKNDLIFTTVDYPNKNPINKVLGNKMKKTRKSDNVKNYIVSVVENSSSNSTKTNLLPKTATSHYTNFFIGMALILFGGISYFTLRRKKLD